MPKWGRVTNIPAIRVTTSWHLGCTGASGKKWGGGKKFPPNPTPQVHPLTLLSWLWPAGASVRRSPTAEQISADHLLMQPHQETHYTITTSHLLDGTAPSPLLLSPLLFFPSNSSPHPTSFGKCVFVCLCVCVQIQYFWYRHGERERSSAGF